MTDFLTPVGRLVQGSLYNPQTKNMNGEPIIIKNGPDAGKPGCKYYFALAVQKMGEAHWNQTDWGKKIWAEGESSWISGQYKSPHFAWKITDGDSTEPNREGAIPANKPGHAGCWILNFSMHNIAPVILDRNAKQDPALLIKNAIKPGYYIAVYGSVSGNNTASNPGVYLNYRYVGFMGYGEEIVLKDAVDPETIGFDKLSIPAAASQIPVNTGFKQDAVATTSVDSVVPSSAQVAPTPVVPHTAILNPPPPPPPVVSQKVLTPKAVQIYPGVTYEAFMQGGWTDEILIQHGYLNP